jgi:hypothetical protein
VCSSNRRCRHLKLRLLRIRVIEDEPTMTATRNGRRKFGQKYYRSVKRTNASELLPSASSRELCSPLPSLVPMKT